jgi:hypothetical protein
MTPDRAPIWSSLSHANSEEERVFRIFAFQRQVLLPLLLAFACGLHAATTIIAATALGPVKSTDGGATWSVLPVNVNSGLLSGQPSFDALAVDPKTPSTWYATGYAGAYGFYRSTDSGQTWTGTPFVTFRPLGYAASIVIDPVDNVFELHDYGRENTAKGDGAPGEDCR